MASPDACGFCFYTQVKSPNTTTAAAAKGGKGEQTKGDEKMPAATEDWYHPSLQRNSWIFKGSLKPPAMNTIDLWSPCNFTEKRKNERKINIFFSLSSTYRRRRPCCAALITRRVIGWITSQTLLCFHSFFFSKVFRVTNKEKTIDYIWFAACTEETHVTIITRRSHHSVTQQLIQPVTKKAGTVNKK